jgi:hypothetical protein
MKSRRLIERPQANVCHPSTPAGTDGGIVHHSKFVRRCLSWVNRDGRNSASIAAMSQVIPEADIDPIPRDGAIIFGGLIGKLDVLRVECSEVRPVVPLT